MKLKTYTTMTDFKEQSGKVDIGIFEEILYPHRGFLREEVLEGPAFGMDVSVIDLGDGKGLAVSSDPLSLITSLGLRESAWLSVHLLANDMATTGFAPQYAQFVLNLPPSLGKNAFMEYWQHISSLCEQTGVAITGGHTGKVQGQNSTIPGGGTMFLTAPADKIITSNRAEPGDQIVVSKEAALVSSSILAMSFPETVKNRAGQEVFHKGCQNFYKTSSLNDALSAASILKNNVELKAMHDVTEGGILGAIFEMAKASGCGFVVQDDLLPVTDVPRSICSLFDIDPRFSVGAGSMIMAVKKGVESRLIDHLQTENVPAAVVGEFTEAASGFRLIKNDIDKKFVFDGKDPYWNAFFKAVREGWK
jgi:hydrogenase expression/formation protein HypE